MILEALVTKYLNSADQVLSQMQLANDELTVEKTDIAKVVDSARAYLADAKYYKAQKRLETSLTSVAYCEGLLDALKLLGAVKFEWPANPINEK